MVPSIKTTALAMLLTLSNCRAENVPILSEVLTNITISAERLSGELLPTPNRITCELVSAGKKSTQKLTTHEVFQLQYGQNARLTRKGLEIQVLSIHKAGLSNEKSKVLLKDMRMDDFALKWPTVGGYLVQLRKWVEPNSPPAVERIFIFFAANQTRDEGSRLVSQVEDALGASVTVQAGMYFATPKQ